jgi:D-arginine dehydrogenase
MSERDRYDVIIIGAGIAGASFAYFLSRRGIGDVLLVERERTAGCHATGRSAAVAYPLDPHPVIQQLKAPGIDFLRNPPEGFSQHPLLTRCGAMLVLKDPLWSSVQKAVTEHASAKGVSIELLPCEEARRRVPVLDPGEFDGALFLPDAARIDVHELLGSYLRGAKRLGVEVRYDLEITGIRVDRGACTGVVTPRGEIRASRIVDAAGAWAGELGRLAGAAPIEITPLRRCAIVYQAPENLDMRGWPHVGSAHHSVYFEPESGGILMSPMDEEPTPACDAQPDELAIAAGLERLRALAPDLVPHSIRRSWAGLRTFCSDGAPVVGEDPILPGFFWLAGQGGNGIATSAGLGPVAVDLFAEGRTERFDASLLSPTRFR